MTFSVNGYLSLKKRIPEIELTIEDQNCADKQEQKERHGLGYASADNSDPLTEKESLWRSSGYGRAGVFMRTWAGRFAL